jgi:uncharacterized protein (TIGR02270 family)
MTESSTHSRERLALLSSTAPALTEHYADLLAFGWRRRADRLTEPTLVFRDLLESDDRLHAALDTLLRLGRYARLHLTNCLAQPITANYLFALTLYALAAADCALLDACTDLATALPDMRPAFTEAFEWAPASEFLQTRIEALPPASRMHVVAVRYRDFAGLTDRTLEGLATLEPTSDNLRALCALIRHLGRQELTRMLLVYLDHEGEAVRLSIVQAALTVAPSVHRATVLEKLGELIHSNVPAISAAAIRLAVLHEPAWTANLLDWLRCDRDRTRSHLLALGWSGTTHAVPVLMEYLSDIQHARVAAASLALIVGATPMRDVRGTMPEPDAGGDQIADPDPDRNLPWPDAAACAEWWRSRSALFDPKLRYLAGRPIERRWLADLLMSGQLAWRPLAAEHRQALAGGPLFPVGTCAVSQRALFRELN